MREKFEVMHDEEHLGRDDFGIKINVLEKLRHHQAALMGRERERNLIKMRNL